MAFSFVTDVIVIVIGKRPTYKFPGDRDIEGYVHLCDLNCNIVTFNEGRIIPDVRDFFEQFS